MVQLVTRVDDQLASAVDDLVAAGVVDSRSDAVRIGLRQLLPQSELVVLADAPHGCNVSHAEQFNDALLDFLAK